MSDININNDKNIWDSLRTQIHNDINTCNNVRILYDMRTLFLKYIEHIEHDNIFFRFEQSMYATKVSLFSHDNHSIISFMVDDTITNLSIDMKTELLSNLCDIFNGAIKSIDAQIQNILDSSELGISIAKCIPLLLIGILFISPLISSILTENNLSNSISILCINTTGLVMVIYSIVNLFKRFSKSKRDKNK